MKKILTILFLFFISVTSAFAKSDEHYINFAGEQYRLLYSVKSPDFGGYLNEYYKKRETYNIWSEMVAVHHFPNAYSPIDQIKSFREYLGSMHCPSALTFDDKRNAAIIDFIIINDKNLPIILEFNVFKYQKSPKCGSVAVQYVKRYAVTTAFQLEAAKRDIENKRKKIIKQVNSVKIPEVVAMDIDKCKVIENVSEDKKENEITEQKDDVIEQSMEEVDTVAETKENILNENESISDIKSDEFVSEEKIITVSDKENVNDNKDDRVDVTVSSVQEKSEQKELKDDLTKSNVKKDSDIDKTKESSVKPGELKKTKDSAEAEKVQLKKEVKQNKKDVKDSVKTEKKQKKVKKAEKKKDAKVKAPKKDKPVKAEKTKRAENISSEKQVKPKKVKNTKKSAKARAKQAAKKLAE